MKKRTPDNPCGVLQCLDYLTYIDHYHERIRMFHVKDADERVIDRLDLDEWIARQPKTTGKLRHPVAATEARRAAA